MSWFEKDATGKIWDNVCLKKKIKKGRGWAMNYTSLTKKEQVHSKSNKEWGGDSSLEKNA